MQSINHSLDQNNESNRFSIHELSGVSGYLKQSHSVRADKRLLVVT
jgi:hypothetical protein